MKSTEMLNQIKTLLNIEVKLEEQKLENGESRSFLSPCTNEITNDTRYFRYLP